MSNLASAHRYLAFAFLFLGVVQFFLAGLGTFGAESFEPHQAVGSLLTLLALVLLVLAAVGRRPALPASAALFALSILQMFLGVAGEDVGLFGGLHPVNGLLVL